MCGILTENYNRFQFRVHVFTVFTLIFPRRLITSWKLITSIRIWLFCVFRKLLSCGRTKMDVRALFRHFTWKLRVFSSRVIFLQVFSQLIWLLLGSVLPYNTCILLDRVSSTNFWVNCCLKKWVRNAFKNFFMKAYKPSQRLYRAYPNSRIKMITSQSIWVLLSVYLLC